MAASTIKSLRERLLKLYASRVAAYKARDWDRCDYFQLCIDHTLAEIEAQKAQS